ncbi:hypothetical protein BV22DRAFT_1135281 [Leucogyrophana mollusca]|uniref:Uncharacterized protein n=1 Tax=Leucogyrophana mollusca TaxID=85980 RepID=A0ACB8AVS6_9AGAM|nr:hypothetical protein BV22DRAFT_1135281 [Leucogyrophana mollusca]
MSTASAVAASIPADLVGSPTAAIATVEEIEEVTQAPSPAGPASPCIHMATITPDDGHRTDVGGTVCILSCCVNLVAHAVIHLLSLPQHTSIIRNAVREVIAGDSTDIVNATDVSDAAAAPGPVPVYDCVIPGLSTRALPIVRGLPIASTMTAHSPAPVKYFVPAPDAVAPFYTVSCGLAVGVFSTWLVMSPLVCGVRTASCRVFDDLEDAKSCFEEVIQKGCQQILQ